MNLLKLSVLIVILVLIAIFRLGAGKCRLVWFIAVIEGVCSLAWYVHQLCLKCGRKHRVFESRKCLNWIKYFKAKRVKMKIISNKKTWKAHRIIWMISHKKVDKPSHQFHFCRRRKINRRLIMNNNCKETVLCYNFPDSFISDDNFRYSIWLWYK